MPAPRRPEPGPDGVAAVSDTGGGETGQGRSSNVMSRRTGKPIKFDRRTKSVLIALTLLIAAGGYVWVLKTKNRAVAERFVRLEHKDVRAYLSHVRQTRGFTTYVGEFAKLRHYDAWQEDAPPFLVGRWALFEEPQRVSENYFPEVCRDAVEIEDGRFKHLLRRIETHKARYRIKDGRVVVRLGDGKTVPVGLASYGTALHHIVVTLPGDRERYGYLCK